MNSINNSNNRRPRQHFYHDTAVPSNNRGQPLEARHMRDVSQPRRRHIGFTKLEARPGFDNQGEFWGPHLNVFRNIQMPGQTRRKRKRMACILRKHGLMDKYEIPVYKRLHGIYPTPVAILYGQQGVRFYDERVDFRLCT